MKKAVFYLVFFSLAWFDCVDEIYLDIPSDEANLVIDAWLGPSSDRSYVRVYRSTQFLSGTVTPQYTKVPVTRVYVEDESGQWFYFQNMPDSAIYYRPETDQLFESGKRYRLNVVTDQDEYQSEWSLMPEPSLFDGFEAIAKERPVFVISGNLPVQVTGVSATLTVEVTKPSEQEVGYLISATGFSEVFTTGDSEVCKCNCYLDVPILFSGMNLEASGSGTNPKSITLAELDITSLGRFYLQSTVRTVSKDNLEYLQLIDKQQRSTGSIFDPAPFKIKGNINSVTHPGQEVLGNFIVFQENTFSQMIYRSEIYRMNPSLSFAFDQMGHVRDNCNEYYPFSLPHTPEPFQP